MALKDDLAALTQEVKATGDVTSKINEAFKAQAIEAIKALDPESPLNEHFKDRVLQAAETGDGEGLFQAMALQLVDVLKEVDALMQKGDLAGAARLGAQFRQLVHSSLEEGIGTQAGQLGLEIVAEATKRLTDNHHVEILLAAVWSSGQIHALEKTKAALTLFKKKEKG
jgi:hypothetical protein